MKSIRFIVGFATCMLLLIQATAQHALAFFIYLLCWTNEPVLFDDVAFRLISDIFLIPFCILFFAFMYKVAADAVEENNLTI